MTDTFQMPDDKGKLDGCKGVHVLKQDNNVYYLSEAMYMTCVLQMLVYQGKADGCSCACILTMRGSPPVPASQVAVKLWDDEECAAPE